MERGKRVFGVMIVSLLLISSISLISAGFWGDLFTFGEYSDLEGELADSFDLGISMTNQRPYIDSWDAPTGSPTACQTSTTSTFEVRVTDPDGDSDLEDGGEVWIQFTNTHASLGEQSRPASAIQCTAGSADADNQLEFICPVITMNYWDDGGVGDTWTITITGVTDGADFATNTGNTGVQASDGGASYPHFTYISSLISQIKDSSDVDYTTGGAGTDTISFSGVTTTSFDKESDTYMTTKNCANAVITTTEITGSDLTSVAIPSTPIEPDSFSVLAAPDAAVVNPCNTGDAITKAGPDTITSGGVIVSTGSDSTKDFDFCLEDINPDGTPDPITVGTYSTASPWTIDFS